jgi:hypothetical protein
MPQYSYPQMEINWWWVSKKYDISLIYIKFTNLYIIFSPKRPKTYYLFFKEQYFTVKIFLLLF